MRIPTVLLAVLLAAAPGIPLARTETGAAPDRSPVPDMAAMQRAVEAMQRCMADVDMDAVTRTADEARAFTQELRGLCAAGRRGRAQERALEYAQRMQAHPELQKLRDCGEQMREAMAGMPMMRAMPSPDFPTREEIEAQHVCDGL